MRKAFLAVILVFIFPSLGFAQDKSGTYLKGEFVHGDFGLYGHEIYFNDLSLGVEHFWAKRHGSLSGFSFGYRKEDFTTADTGHFFNGKVLWKFGSGFYLKPAIGVEWGKPSLRFEKTFYDEKTGLSYVHTTLIRNAWLPVGVRDTGALYMVMDISIGRKAGLFIFEAGARAAHNKFGISVFELDKGGNLKFQSFRSEYKFIPTLFVSVGLKMF